MSLTYQASERERTSSPEGSTCEGMASRTISRMEISLRTASSPGTFTKRPRSSLSRASRSSEGCSTAEWASVRVCDAGSTGTLTRIASENPAERKVAVYSQFPALEGAVTKVFVTVSPAGTLTGKAALPPSHSSESVPETGSSAMDETTTAASQTSPS